MKRRISYIYTILGIMLIAFTLISFKSVQSDVKTDMHGFTLRKAKDFYYERMEQTADAVRARASRKRDAFSLCPDGFVPKWKLAVASAQDNLVCYDIPIKTDRWYEARLSDYKSGEKSYYTVTTSQKMVIVKDLKTNVIELYILTLIPNREYYAKYKNDIGERFINCGDKGEFSGIAIYTQQSTNRMARVSRYEKGQLAQSVYLLGEPETLKERVSELRSIIKDLTLKRYPEVFTQAEEDAFRKSMQENSRKGFYESTRTFNEEGYVYQCDVDEKIGFVRLYNKENKLTYVLQRDSTKAAPTPAFYSYKGKVEDDDWTGSKRIEIVNDAFSRLEKKRLKDSKFTILLYIDPNSGKISEVQFQFSSFWPCATIPVSVYRKIETELKKNIWYTPTAEGKKLNYILVGWRQQPE